MILDYNRKPDATVDEKVQSLMESTQLALNDISRAQQTADVAKDDAQASIALSQTAREAANAASSAASQASTAASQAKTSADQAKENADAAKSSAEQAIADAATAGKAASVAQAAAEAAQGDIDEQKEWFWHDSNGSHVLGDTSGFRNDTDSTGMRIVETATEESVAEYTADGIRIGKEDEQRVVIKKNATEYWNEKGVKVGEIAQGGQGTVGIVDEVDDVDFSKSQTILIPLSQAPADTVEVSLSGQVKNNPVYNIDYSGLDITEMPITQGPYVFDYIEANNTLSITYTGDGGSATATNSAQGYMVSASYQMLEDTEIKATVRVDTTSIQGRYTDTFEFGTEKTWNVNDSVGRLVYDGEYSFVLMDSPLDEDDFIISIEYQYPYPYMSSIEISYIAQMKLPYFTFGTRDTADPGNFSTVIGENNDAEGEASLATGMGTSAKGEASAAFGTLNKAEGDSSAAFGQGNKVTFDNGFVLGQYADPGAFQNIEYKETTKYRAYNHAYAPALTGDVDLTINGYTFEAGDITEISMTQKSDGGYLSFPYKLNVLASNVPSSGTIDGTIAYESNGVTLYEGFSDSVASYITKSGSNAYFNTERLNVTSFSLTFSATSYSESHDNGDKVITINPSNATITPDYINMNTHLEITEPTWRYWISSADSIQINWSEETTLFENGTVAIYAGNGQDSANLSNAFAITWTGDLLLDMNYTDETDKSIMDSLTALGWYDDCMV